MLFVNLVMSNAVNSKLTVAMLSFKGRSVELRRMTDRFVARKIFSGPFEREVERPRVRGCLS